MPLTNVRTYELMNSKGRLLAHLVSNCVVEQQDTDAFRQTAFSKAMCDPGKTCWMQLLYAIAGRAHLRS